MNIIALVKLTENDKRVIIAILLIIILFIILIGYIAKLVMFIMRHQGMRIDKMMYNIMYAKVITKEKDFVKEASYKSHVFFIKTSIAPFVIMLVSSLAFILYSYFAHEMSFTYYVDAFNELSFTLDWPLSPFFGLNIPSDWPTVSKAPDFSFSVDKYLSLFLTLLFSSGGIWFLVNSQALLARRLRIIKLKHTYFTKDINKLSNDHVNK